MVQLLFFVAAVVGTGWLIGATNLPGAWYANLAKPAFVPPNWVFPVVWTALYVMIAVAGWRTFRIGHEEAMAVWLAQLALNFAWSPVMFRMHRIGAALAVLLLLFATTLIYLVLEINSDILAAGLFVPYAAWVGFAGIINAAIWKMNRI